ncbi:MAG: hypothetical protein ABI462_00425 [Ignavibacteria bacterium]
MSTIEAESELSVIKKIMEDSRRLNIDNGKHYLMWGILVTFALICNYIMLLTKTGGQYIGIMWFVLMISGAIIDSIMKKREVRTLKANTYAGNIVGSLWLASGIAMFIYGFVGLITKSYNPVFICPIISTSLGISYYTSGAIQRLKWLQNVSYGWWAGAIFLFVFPSIHSVLVFALMLVAFQIVPGIILNINSKKFLESEAHTLNV